jgi:ketosteroid isomerase-like protein
MAGENVKALRGSYDAFRRRDLERFLSYMDRDVEFKSLVLEVEGAYHGHDGVRAWWESVLAVFPDWSPTVEDAEEVGDRLVVRVRAEGRGTGSGIVSERDIWQVADVRDGRLKSWAFFRTRQEALEAAGLRG